MTLSERLKKAAEFDRDKVSAIYGGYPLSVLNYRSVEGHFAENARLRPILLELAELVDAAVHASDLEYFASGGSTARMFNEALDKLDSVLP